MGLRQVTDLSDYSIPELLRLIRLATKLLKQKLSGEVADQGWSDSDSGISVIEPGVPVTSHAPAASNSIIHLLLVLFAIPGLANSTASIVEFSVAVQTLTKTMPVLATGTCDDAADDGSDSGFGAAEPKGFRKRWVKRPLEPKSDSFGETNEGDGFSDLVDRQPVLQKKAKSAGAGSLLPVVDSTVDELVEQQHLKASVSNKEHQLGRNALLGTDVNVFKYPWEKGRLAKIFGSEPLVKPPSLKLKPGGVNPVQISLDVGASGSISAKTSVTLPTDDKAIFMQVVHKVDDVVNAVDKKQKRQSALVNFWELLSHSICSSTVGLKVTVEATPDSVCETALKILDAVFAVKSPGTLSRRLYSLQSFEQWCVEKFSEHWIPVSEMRVWQYVQHLKVPPRQRLQVCWRRSDSLGSSLEFMVLTRQKRVSG